jgi:hypothetical protein
MTSNQFLRSLTLSLALWLGGWLSSAWAWIGSPTLVVMCGTAACRTPAQLLQGTATTPFKVYWYNYGGEAGSYQWTLNATFTPSSGGVARVLNLVSSSTSFLNTPDSSILYKGTDGTGFAGQTGGVNGAAEFLVQPTEFGTYTFQLQLCRVSPSVECIASSTNLTATTQFDNRPPVANLTFQSIASTPVYSLGNDISGVATILGGTPYYAFWVDWFSTSNPPVGRARLVTADGQNPLSDWAFPASQPSNLGDTFKSATQAGVIPFSFNQIGSYTFTLQLCTDAKDTSGNYAFCKLADKTRTLNVTQMVGPPPPVPPSINVVAGNDVINIAKKNTTVTGNRLDGMTVTLRFGNSTQSRTAIGLGTNWSYPLTETDIADLGQGASQAIRAKQTNASGISSTEVTRRIQVVTVAPNSPGINTVAGDDVVNLQESKSDLLITGTCVPQAQVSVAVDGGAFITAQVNQAQGTWSYTLAKSTLGTWLQGTHTFSAVQADAVGNLSATAQRAVKLDTLPPSSPVIDPITGDDVIGPSEQTATLTGHCETGASVQLGIGSGVNSVQRSATVVGNTWSYALVAEDISTWGQGKNKVLTAQQTNAVGNVSSMVSRSLTVSTLAAPSMPLIAPIASSVTPGTAVALTWRSSSTGDFWNIRLNQQVLATFTTFNQSAQGTSAGSYQLSLLKEGVYSLFVELCNAAGCTPSKTLSMTVSVLSQTPGTPLLGTIPSTRSPNTPFTLSWSLPSGNNLGTSWQVWDGTQVIYTSSVFDTPDKASLQTGSTSISLGTLGAHSLKIALCNAANTCTFSTPYNVTVANSFPNKPTLNALPSKVTTGSTLTIPWSTRPTASDLPGSFWNVLVNGAIVLSNQTTFTTNTSTGQSGSSVISLTTTGTSTLQISLCGSLNVCSDSLPTSISVQADLNSILPPTPGAPTWVQNAKTFTLGTPVSLKWRYSQAQGAGLATYWQIRDGSSLILDKYTVFDTPALNGAAQSGFYTYTPSLGTHSLKLTLCNLSGCGLSSEIYSFVVSSTATTPNTNTGNIDNAKPQTVDTNSSTNTIKTIDFSGINNIKTINTTGNNTTTPALTSPGTTNPSNVGTTDANANTNGSGWGSSSGNTSTSNGGGRTNWGGGSSGGGNTLSIPPLPQATTDPKDGSIFMAPPSKPTIVDCPDVALVGASVPVKWSVLWSSPIQSWQILDNGQSVYQSKIVQTLPGDHAFHGKGVFQIKGADTAHKISIQACNSKGCATGEAKSLRVYESDLMAKPKLGVLANTSPGQPTIQRETGISGREMSLTWNLWTQPTGTSWTVNDNGIKVCEGQLDPTRFPQSGTCRWSLSPETIIKPHSLSVGVCNAQGCTSSAPYTVSRF